ncbi:MAG TPA: type B DNA-directed DNA polymerase [Methanoregulaceae archaeon]|nr:MAG: type B DNA-directed DNA polymerase [Methanolinea sp.]HON81239.1 type B DNA-directed DNA polymerase [Methanoregulaceae archaeon]HPD10155.1 type B DNA-directed DNA polymerase [Methanoregulaceae archaeon]HRT15161.1 type B DNA-directed DNA polymerase [Methanoregulaceae archaeon]HRU30722.1 type B DNA-directed DNA polymerase [Methanoregulaceae archaeon]
MIIDTRYYRDGVEIWEWSAGTTRRTTVPYAPSFYLHLPDPALHRELLESLEAEYGAEECTFRTIFGECDGYRIPAGREIAEAIERQTGYAAQLYNVDVRLDQRYLAGVGQVPCCCLGESRFSLDFPIPFRTMTVEVEGSSFRGEAFRALTVVHERHERLGGPWRTALADLAGLLASCDPDVVLFPRSDLWLPRLLSLAREEGVVLPFSRSGRYREMAQKSYWSYGRTEFRAGSLIPDGRILVDTIQSFQYRESGLPGIILGARLTGLPPNLTARFTSGTLISAYEVYEALRQGIAVPFRKSDPECVRKFDELKAADRGGMMFQPVPGLYERVYEIDFTSLYPSIIVACNLSPETLGFPERQGFLPEVLAPLLSLRKESKARKATDPAFAGTDALLKWMLVTCFGYTGYKNAKFGQIEVHEKITGHAREILVRTKEIAEDLGFSVLHGIVDCLFVQDGPAAVLKERVESETGLPTTVDAYDWIAFLPMPDGFGAYNRYYGRLSTGDLKVRGIAARRGDTPVFVRDVQERMLSTIRDAEDCKELAALSDRVGEQYREAVAGLSMAAPEDMAISRRISRLRYSHRCPEASAVAACTTAGIEIFPGMQVSYVVTDARTWAVELDWSATRFDVGYYRKLLDKAWLEVAFALDQAKKGLDSNSAWLPGDASTRRSVPTMQTGKSRCQQHHGQ